MIFSFLLCIKLNAMSDDADMGEFKFLLTGGVSLGEELPEKPAEWLSDNAWGELLRACLMPGFNGFLDHFKANISTYQELNDHPDPQEWEFPPASLEILNKLRLLIVLRCLRPDKLVPAISLYVINYLGEEFVKPPPFELPTIYKDSSSTTALIFVLSPGSDPMNALSKFGDVKKKTIEPVSLGQGQGPKAENAIKEAQKSGNWVVL
jgi:dynein heavy chain